MTETTHGFDVLDPTWDESTDPFIRALRLGSVKGTTIGVISNGKQGTRAFFEGLSQALIDDYGVAAVPVVVKDNYSAPAGPDVIDHARAWHAVISGIGD